MPSAVKMDMQPLLKSRDTLSLRLDTLRPAWTPSQPLALLPAFTQARHMGGKSEVLQTENGLTGVFPVMTPQRLVLLCTEAWVPAEAR